MTSCAALAVPVTLFFLFPVVSATYSPVSEFTNPTSDTLDPPLLENLYVTTAEPVIVNSNPDDPAFPISTDVTAGVPLLTTSPNVTNLSSANFVPDEITSLSAAAVSVVASNEYSVSETASAVSRFIVYILVPLLYVFSGEIILYVPASKLYVTSAAVVPVIEFTFSPFVFVT